MQKLLKSKQNGLWATRLRPEFKNMFGELLPDDIQNIIQEHFLSFIKVDRYIGFIEGFDACVCLNSGYVDNTTTLLYTTTDFRDILN